MHYFSRKLPDAKSISQTHVSRSKRWVAAALCAGLVATASGVGYWSNYVYLSDLTAMDAWNRYMDLVRDGKYDEALAYSPVPFADSTRQPSSAFLTDAAHAHAPSSVTFQGEVSQKPTNRSTDIWIEGAIQFNDGTTTQFPSSTRVEKLDRRNGQLGMWKIDLFASGLTIDHINTDDLRSIRVGDILISDPQGSYYLFPGSYRIEAVPRNPDYWTIQYEIPLNDGTGELRTHTTVPPFTIIPSDKLTDWIRKESEAFAASCRTGTPDPAREGRCGALAYSTAALDLTNETLLIGSLHGTSFWLSVPTGPTDPAADSLPTPSDTFTCTIDFAYDGAQPTLECTLDK